MKAYLDGNTVWLESQPHLSRLVRQVPGLRFDSDSRRWHAPISWALAWQMRNTFGDKLEVDESLRSWVDDYYFSRVEEAMDLKAAADVDGDERLTPLQRVGTRFLQVAGGAVLEDEMGAGKTVQVSVAVRELKELPVLVLCPSSVKRSWACHLEEWAGLRVSVADGSAAKRRKAIAAVEEGMADALVINYESAWRHTRLGGYGNIKLKRCEECGGADKGHCEVEKRELNRINWTVVIADEAHRLKNPKAKQTRGAWQVSAGARYRWALTGTPIANHPGDYWSLLRFVDPDEWPARTRYVDRYCLQSFNPFGGLDIVGLKPSTRDEFHTVVGPRRLRRTQEEVLGRRIEKVRETRWVQLKPKHRRLYKTLREEMLVALDDGGHLLARNPLEVAGRCFQLASAPLEQDEDGEYRMVAPSPKVAALDELLDDLGDEPLVVFVKHIDLFELCRELLEKRGVRYAQLRGSVPAEERALEVERFQAGDARVFLASLGAGGEGIDLYRARYACFLQRSWSLVENRQAEDRIRRRGQEADSVTIVEVVAEDTIEERVLEVNEEKGGRLEELVRDKERLKELT